MPEKETKKNVQGCKYLMRLITRRKYYSLFLILLKWNKKNVKQMYAYTLYMHTCIHGMPFLPFDGHKQHDIELYKYADIDKINL